MEYCFPTLRPQSGRITFSGFGCWRIPTSISTTCGRSTTLKVVLAIIAFILLPKEIFWLVFQWFFMRQILLSFQHESRRPLLRRASHRRTIRAKIKYAEVCAHNLLRSVSQFAFFFLFLPVLQGAATEPESLEDATKIFAVKPFCTYVGHTADLLDVSWSKVTSIANFF